MKVLLTDGVREVKLLVEGDLEEFSRFLREFVAVKIVPVPTARRFARDIILYDSINTDVKVYPFAANEEYEFCLLLDPKRSTVTLLDEDGNVIDEMSIKTEAATLVEFSDVRDTEEEGDRKKSKASLDEVVEAVEDLSREFVELQKRFYENALETTHSEEGKLADRHATKKLIVIEKNGVGVVLEVTSKLTAEEIADLIREEMGNANSHMYAFARDVMKTLDAQVLEDIWIMHLPTLTPLEKGVRLVEEILPTDLTPMDMYLEDLQEECVYVDLNREVVMLL